MFLTIGFSILGTLVANSIYSVTLGRAAYRDTRIKTSWRSWRPVKTKIID